MVKIPRKRVPKVKHIIGILTNPKRLRVSLNYIRGNNVKTSKLVQEILDGNPNDIYALDVKAKLEAQKKKWTSSHNIFCRIKQIDRNFPNINIQILRTGIYSSLWDSIANILREEPSLIELNYFKFILEKKLRKEEHQQQWKTISELAKIVLLPKSIIEIWIKADEHVPMSIEELKTSGEICRQASQLGLPGRHILIVALGMIDTNAYLQQSIKQFGIIDIAGWTAKSDLMNQELLVIPIQERMRTLDDKSIKNCVQEMAKYTPIFDIISSGIIPEHFLDQHHDEMMSMVHLDVGHQLSQHMAQGRYREARKILKSIGYLSRELENLELWITTCKSLLKFGHPIVARKISLSLLLLNPTNVDLAEIYFQSYVDTFERTNSLIAGEILTHMIGTSLQSREIHGENMMMRNNGDMADQLLGQWDPLYTRGTRLRMGYRFYDKKDPESVIEYYESLAEKFYSSSEFSSHAAISYSDIGMNAKALETIHQLSQSGEANSSFTEFEIERRRGNNKHAIQALNRSLNRYGYLPFSKKWSDSNFQLTELDVVSSPVSTDKRLTTIIMTSHKVNPMIHKAIESVLNQTHRSFELLIIDDASRKEDSDYYQKFTTDSRVRIIRMDKNSGTYACRNVGIEQAKGEFITFMDSDDWQHPQKIEMCIRRLDENPSLCATMDSYVRMTPSGKLATVGSWFVRKCLMGIMWRTEPLRNVLGGFDPVRTSADSELLERAELVLGKDAIQHVPVCTYIATFSEDTLTQSGNFAIDWKGVDGPRGEYVAAYRKWHRRNIAWPERLKIERNAKIGAFKIPNEMIRTGIGPAPDDILGELKIDWFENRDINIQPIQTFREFNPETPIIICMATYPGRFNVIGKTVQSLLNQTIIPTKIKIHVNQSDKSPPLPKDERIEVHLSPELNITDIGKFKLAAEEKTGIILTVDDDIHYPKDYVETMVSAVNRYSGNAIIGVHGCVLPVGEPVKDWKDYRQNRRVHWFRRSVSVDVPVNIVGTGTMAYDATKMKFNWQDYQEQRMVDIHVAVEAQENKWPMISPIRPREWMVPIDPDEGDEAESIWNMVQTDLAMQNDIINKLQSINEWNLFIPNKEPITKSDLDFLNINFREIKMMEKNNVQLP